MIVKCFLVNELEELINYIINYFCKNNISYIYIKETQELHFDKYIFKFFTKKEIFKYIIEKEKLISSHDIISLDPEDVISVSNNINTKKYNNNDIFKYNKTTNIKLKKQHIPQKRFIRR